jgi:hypothetical protein
MAQPSEIVREIIRRTPLYGALRARKLQGLHQAWIRNGRRLPPSHVFKQSVVKETAESHGLRTLVETGTYLGDMIAAAKDLFNEIYSIELNPKFYEIARRRFSRQRHVRIALGDSGEVLGQVLSGIKAPCLFWLDGHYTRGEFAIRGDRETPIEKELRHIARHPLKLEHVILIDDARDYTGSGDYPSIETLKAWAESEGFTDFAVENDIIRVSARGQ